LRSFEWYYLWRLCHGARLTLRGHPHVVYAVAVSPDGTTLTSGCHDGTVKLWNPATGQELASVQGHARAIYALAYSPDGQLLAAGTEDGLVKLWNAATRQELRSFPAHPVGVLALAFAADGRLATAGGDGKVHLWDAATGARQLVLDGHKGRVWS